jgi:regulation of enolase protein 1 (concanavalin A-like superfamily)
LASTLNWAVLETRPPGVIHIMLVTKLKGAAVVILFVAGTGVGDPRTHMHAAEAVPQAPNSRSSSPTGLAEQTDRLSLRGWGAALDPAGDCRFLVERGKLTISIPAGDHALALERGQMNAPRLVQPVEGDFIVQVKVGGEFPAGGAALVQSRRPFHGAGLLVYQDDKNYIRLEKAGLIYAGEQMHYVSWELRKDGEFARAGNAGEFPLTEKEVFLRVERRGDKLLGSVSSDGIRWSPLDPIVVELSRKLMVGIVAGHNTGRGFSPQFTEFGLFRQVDQ